MSLVSQKLGLDLFVGQTDIKIMSKRKSTTNVEITIHAPDRTLKSISIAGSEISISNFPKVVTSISALQYALKLVLELQPCKGYIVSINNKKLSVTSKQCKGYISGRSTNSYCQSCSAEQSRNSIIKGERKLFVHMDHSYAIPNDTTSSPDPALDCHNDSDTDGELTENDLSDNDDDDDEKKDPTYSPDMPATQPKTVNPNINPEEIVDTILKQCPSLSSIGEGFKLLLISQIKNSSGEKRRRRWDTE